MLIVPGTVTIGYVHTRIVHEGFARSLAEACLIKENNIYGITSVDMPRQEHARNTVISRFLDGARHGKDHVGTEWLMWIDTDMTFDPDAIARLLDTANKTKADMVAGLGFLYAPNSPDVNTVRTNAWHFNRDTQHWEDIDDYTPGKIYEIDGTGTGFLLVNRRVFTHNDNNEWHRSGVHPVTGNYMGHDLAFCYDRVVAGPFKLVWDTNVKTGHIKQVRITEDIYRSYRESLA